MTPPTAASTAASTVLFPQLAQERLPSSTRSAQVRPESVCVGSSSDATTCQCSWYYFRVLWLRQVETTKHQLIVLVEPYAYFLPSVIETGFPAPSYHHCEILTHRVPWGLDRIAPVRGLALTHDGYRVTNSSAVLVITERLV